MKVPKVLSLLWFVLNIYLSTLSWVVMAVEHAYRLQSSRLRSSLLTSNRHRRRRTQFLANNPSLNYLFASTQTKNDQKHDDNVSMNEPSRQSLFSRSSFWPPWPFNLLQRDRGADGSVIEADNPSVMSMMWGFTKSTTKVGILQIREFGSQLWFHSPPAIPPIVLYALYPYRQRVMYATGSTLSSIGDTVAETAAYKTILPFWSNGWVRNGILFAAGLAIASWAHAEIHRHRNLTPLPLLYRDLSRAELPPFLPEQVSTTFMFTPVPTSSGMNVAPIQEEDGETGASAAILPLTVTSTVASISTVDDEADEGILANLSPRLRRHWMQLRDMAPRPASLRTMIGEWRRMRQVQKAERQNAHRLAIYEELATWQQATSRHNQHSKIIDRRRSRWNPFSGNNSPNATGTATSDIYDTTASSGLGYALVTGASQGIGRAIAVELARWRIPLILVARDSQTLTDLAFDLQTCYGVECAVLPADLSRPFAAEKIYKTVIDAGLKVDVLVNNAGISSHGESLDMSLDEVLRMIQVNTVAVTSLTHLFGRDMKDRRRGRILLISSVCGAVGGIATVAVYAATKAFENSFGAAIGKELEPYGVGVTCLLPGAVRGTEFRSRSNSQEALCWKIPFYPKTPSAVAECGVRAMLRGDTEVMPGVLNRLFVKVVKPILPQRMHNLLAEIMWNPLQLPFRPTIRANMESLDADPKETSLQDSNKSGVDLALDVPRQRPILVRPQLYFSDPPTPHLLTLDDPSEENVESVASPQSETEDLKGDESLATDDEVPSKESDDVKAIKPQEDGRILDRSAATETKVEKQRANNDSEGTSATSQYQTGTEQKEKETAAPSGPKTTPPSSSELDLLLDQYKKYRALSIEDPWSTGFHFRYHAGDPLLPSLLESRQNSQEA